MDCRICQKPTKGYRAVYCSRTCFGISLRRHKPKACEHCGTLFQRKTRFCRRSCYLAWLREKPCIICQNPRPYGRSLCGKCSRRITNPFALPKDKNTGIKNSRFVEKLAVFCNLCGAPAGFKSQKVLLRTPNSYCRNHIGGGMHAPIAHGPSNHNWRGGRLTFCCICKNPASYKPPSVIARGHPSFCKDHRYVYLTKEYRNAFKQSG